MQIDVPVFLKLAEESGKLVFVDIESSGQKGDYGSVLVISLKPYGKKAQSFIVERPGDDRRILREAKAVMEAAVCWVTYYGKGFDIPFLNTRLLKWGMDPIEKRPHVDMYYTLKSNTLTGRRSQAHLLAWLGTKEQKMTVSADVWASIASNPREHLETMRQRCESDVRGLEALYRKTNHLIRDITR